MTENRFKLLVHLFKYFLIYDNKLYFIISQVFKNIVINYYNLSQHEIIDTHAKIADTLENVEP